jgi:hypothetical protein
MYNCDICKGQCTLSNPVYTNNEYPGCDICSKCIITGIDKIQPLSTFQPEIVYSLKDLVDVITPQI